MSETSLRYWREDPLLNEHHEHWHLVYPYVGREDKDLLTEEELDRIATKKSIARYLIWNDRHGELFAYMHSQLLARYAAERLSAGLALVTPLDDYRKPIREGYNPGIKLKLGNKVVSAANRPNNARLKDLKNSVFKSRPGAQLSSQERFRDRLLAVVGSPSSGNRPATISGFAERIEPTYRLATEYFGALHNDGHLLIALHDDNPERPGCMYWESAAVRDPVFYRWHTHIDDLFRKYQDALPPYTFSDLPPIDLTALSIIGASSQQNDLVTEMRTRNLRSRRFSNVTSIEFLSHEDFTYHLETLSGANTDIDVTVRFFLAPEELVDDRRAWIEMDKFRCKLQRGKSSFLRQSRRSSVVRHPLWTADMLEHPDTGPDESGSSPGCRCGWPYTLLLPRGKPEGMKFHFMAMLTPGEDVVSALDQENSSSYCGLIDSSYPDVRAMGYPFDRPFATSIKDWIAGPARPPQLISTLGTIRHVDRTVRRIR